MTSPSTNSARNQESRLSLTQADTLATNIQGTQLSYRQNRRLQQANRAAATTVYHKRGPSRGLKSRRWREKHPTQKPFARISEDMRRVVGERAAEFISDCSRWVREYCTLKTRNWVGMDRECKERLYSKIQGEWDLPKFVDGVNVKVALSCQCAALYRGWRYHLKEKYFIGYSIAAAKANKPPEIDVNQWNWVIGHYWNDPKTKSISEKNKNARLKQTIKHSNGAKSTARLLDEMQNEPPHIPQDSQQDNAKVLELEPSTQANKEPQYVRLYDKSHRHAVTGLEPDATANLQALKDLHEKEIKEKGADNLTPQQVYARVFKNCSGYTRGLGYGPKMVKRITAPNSEVREEFQQMEQAFAVKELALRDEIERLKQEMTEKENKRVERENQLKQDLMAEIARLMRGST